MAVTLFENKPVESPSQRRRRVLRRLKWISAILLVILAPICFMLYACVSPMLEEERVFRRQVRCERNLEAIWNAMDMYRRRNDMHHPPSLAMALQLRLIDPQTLHCSTIRKHRYCDYFFLADTTNIDANSLIACDLSANHKGEGRAVLKANGWASFMSDAQFAKALQCKENAAFAAALSAAEGQ
jgi:hypothetical protein